MSSVSPLPGRARLAGVHVVVVDDDSDVRDVVSSILRAGGATVTSVASAEEALAALQRERPHVLLSDLAMPSRGGYWLIGQVRALAPVDGGVTPAVALTTARGPQHRASVQRAGFQLEVEKPVSRAGLIEAVGTLASRARVS